MPSNNISVSRLQVSGPGNAGRDLLSEVRSGQQPTVFRAVVQEVFFDVKSLTAEEKTNLKNIVGNPQYVDLMPPCSILARTINNSQDAIDSTPLLVYPFFSSHIMLPIQAGQVVFIIYEDYYYLGGSLARWISRPHENSAVEDLNFTHSDRAFDIKNTPEGLEQANAQRERNAPFILTPAFPNGADLPGRYTINPRQGSNDNPFQLIRSESKSAALQAYEPVPRYNKRPQDLLLQGSNNSMIVLGADRIGPVKNESSQTNEKKPFSGTIDMVTGRGRFPLTINDTQANDDKKTSCYTVENTFRTIENDKIGFQRNKQQNLNEGNPDFINDAARIYISMGTKADINFKIDSTVEGGIRYPTNTLSVTQPNDISNQIGTAYIVSKADHIRIIARKKAQGSAQINGSLLLIKEGTQNEDLAYCYFQNDGKIQIEGNKIYLGQATQENEPYIKWTVYDRHITELKNQIKALSDHVKNMSIALNAAFAGSVAVPFVPVASLVAVQATPAGVATTTTVTTTINTQIDTINTAEAKSQKIFGS
jgi:hypothetical protein